MSFFLTRVLAPTAAAVIALTMAAPALAVDTSFAAYTGNTFTFQATNSGGLVTLSESMPVLFSFLNINLASGIQGVTANIVFNATAPSSVYGSSMILPGLSVGAQSALSGSYVLTSTTPLTIGKTTYQTGSNLLTVNFTNATLSGILGGPNALLSDNNLTGTVDYSSDFLTFPNTVTRDFSISLGAILPLFGGTMALQSFAGTPSGTFASDPVPFSNAVVPEPATWAMMLVGLGAIGVGARRKARQALRAA